MIRVTICFPRVSNRAFDHDYFFDRHLPLLLTRVGVAAKRVTIDRGLSVAPWPVAEHEVICSLECESREAFEAAFFPHIEELQDDMDRCGGAPPSIQLSEIVMAQAAAGDATSRKLGQVHRLRSATALAAAG